MENHLRLILFLVGSIILALVIWDVLRQRRLEKRQAELMQQENGDEVYAYQSRQQSLQLEDSPEDPWVNINEHASDNQSLTKAKQKAKDLTEQYPQQVIINATKEHLAEAMLHSVEAVEHSVELAAAKLAARQTQTIEQPQQLAPLQQAYLQPLQPVPAKPRLKGGDTNLGEMFAIYVMARDEKGFELIKLKRLLEAANLTYGKMNIFHKFAPNNNEEVLFSVASATEPGYFDLTKMFNKYIQGVSIFMLSAKVTDPRKAFDALVRTAKQLAFSLNGELRDQHHNPLTLQYIESKKQSFNNYAARRK